MYYNRLSIRRCCEVRTTRHRGGGGGVFFALQSTGGGGGGRRRRRIFNRTETFSPRLAEARVVAAAMITRVPTTYYTLLNMTHDT